MSRTSIFELPSVKRLIGQQQLSVLAKYLVQNRDYVIPTAENNRYFHEKPIVTTPISHVFSRFAEDGNIADLFSLINVPTGAIEGVPEVLTFTGVTIDTRQIDAVAPHVAAALKSQQNVNGRIILNTTQMVRANGTFSDITGFQNTVVRDILCRSFYSNKRPTWLTPSLSQFVCKVYSMSLATSVAQWYDLDYRTQCALLVLFAHFYLAKMCPADVATGSLVGKYRYFGIPDAGIAENTIGLISATLNKPQMDTLEDLFAVVAQLGVSRIRLDRNILRTRVKFFTDKMMQTIALEYPPYFAYIILLAVSGVKTGLYFKMKDFKLLQPGTEFARALAQAVPTINLTA